MDSKEIKVFMVGHFGARNIGDELILRTQSHLFNQRAKSEILIYSYSTTDDYYKDFPYKYKLIQAFSLKNFLNSLKSIVKAVKYSDIIIIGGGGILQDKYFSYRPLSTLLPAILGYIFNKPVYGYSLGVYHFKHWFNRNLFKLFYDNLSLIGVRDVSSLDNTHRYLKTKDFSKIHLMPDSALAFPIDSLKTNQPEDYIVLVAREVFNQKIKELSKTLIYAGKKFNTTHYKLICFEDIISETDLFINLTNELLSIDNSLHIEIIKFPSVDYYFECISKAKLIISGRLHGCVSSYIISKPVLGLSYEAKVANFCEEHQIPFIDISNPEYNFEEEIFPISSKNFIAEKLSLQEYVDKIITEHKTIKHISFMKKSFIIIRLMLLGSISILVYFIKKN